MEMPSEKERSTKRRILSVFGFGKEKKAIPEIELQEIITNPGQYINLSKFTTFGYPEAVDRQITYIPIPKLMQIGKTQMPQIDWITTETDVYRLHVAPEIESPSIEILVDGGTTYFPYVPLKPEGSNLSTEKHKITGKLSKAREDKTRAEKFVLRVSSAINLEAISK